MGIHAGWPDLSPSRRKSLLQARERANELIAVTQKLFLDYEAFVIRVSAGDIDQRVKQLNQLIALIDAQFPEVRIEAGWNGLFPTTNAVINNELKSIRRALAGCFSLWPWEFDYFVENQEFAVETLTRLKGSKRRKRGCQK